MTRAFVPPFAPLAVLAMLGTAALLIALLLAVVAGSVFRKWKWTKWGSIGAVALAAGYAAVLLASSLVSGDRTLEAGDSKSFCEIDCHLAYSVAQVDVARGPVETRYRVALRTWFDPATISPARGDVPLTPNPRVVYLIDPAGNRYPAAPEAVRELLRPLRPGESFTTALEFRVPSGAVAPRLFVGDPPGPEALLVGHENAPFHGRIYFGLEPPTTATGR
jgi:hypothetical protein